jgi:hypothetical protein
MESTLTSTQLTANSPKRLDRRISLPRGGRIQRAVSAGRIEIDKNELRRQKELVEFREKMFKDAGTKEDAMSDDEENKIEIIEGDAENMYERP